MKVARTVRIGGTVRNNLKDLPIDNHAVMQEQNYWKGQKQKFRKEYKKLFISLEPHFFERLEEFALYNENLNQTASELVIEGLDYIYKEGIPVM